MYPPMAKNLLIVESPAKAKTIEKFLGKDFKVKSSYGHVRDLDKGKNGVKVDEDFKPSYIVSPEKTKVVKELKAELKKVEEVWLATDEDREGEAISWHLCEVLGLDPLLTKRIVFREITKNAVQKAVENPRKVDLNVVKAQQARRILDRLVGFELSEILWRKVRGKLSAGRVQSVAVKLIVDREREINSFGATEYYRVAAIFNVENHVGKKVELKSALSERLKTLKEAETLLTKCKDGIYSILNIEKKPLKRYAKAPFTTSTLQQDASRRMGFAVRRTMSAAQKLYEQGHITYMRTDSTSLSELAIASFAKEIRSSFGDQYLNTKRYKSKDSTAQEAHEAIRPTYIENRSVSGDSDAQRLYDLIWKRAIASQMSPAELEKTTVQIENDNAKGSIFKAEGEVIKFDGFLKVYIETKEEDEDEGSEKGLLPPLKVGQNLDLQIMEARQKYTKPPSRYTEAGLVKKLEELGIGRPSTYAPTISKIMEVKRGYITKESREGIPTDVHVVKLSNAGVIKSVEIENQGATSNRLYPSDIGMVVTDFLSLHFSGIMDYSFTAGVEAKLDNISEGELEWNKMLNDFYDPFHKTVETTIETAERAKGTRELGKDPESGHTVLAQMTRYGPVIQIGTVEEVGEEGKPRFANLKPGQSIETINYEDAMSLFDLPKTLGDYEGKPVEINRGRYGPYVKFDEKFCSIPRAMDPMEVSLEQAIEFIEAKRKEDAPVHTYEEKPVTQGKGRFGPFLKWDGMFINIPRRYDPDNLSVDDMNELIAAKVEKEANRYIQRWDKEKLALENGRWGPFIRSGKKSIKLPTVDGEKIASEDLKTVTLEEVKGLMEGKVPKELEKKYKAIAKANKKAKKKK